VDAADQDMRQILSRRHGLPPGGRIIAGMVDGARRAATSRRRRAPQRERAVNGGAMAHLRFTVSRRRFARVTPAQQMESFAVAHDRALRAAGGKLKDPGGRCRRAHIFTLRHWCDLIFPRRSPI
jgi:hypothetical protein